MKKIALLACIMHLSTWAANDCLNRQTVPDGPMSLQEVIELGLCRNPQTTSAYLAAESARFAKHAGYANNLPRVNAGASAGIDYRNKEWGDWNYGASLSASYLIFDFGKRLADLNALSATWRATGFDYDESVQNYVYGVIGAYYALLNADADVASAEKLREVAQSARDMAQKKY